MQFAIYKKAELKWKRKKYKTKVHCRCHVFYEWPHDTSAFSGGMSQQRCAVTVRHTGDGHLFRRCPLGQTSFSTFLPFRADHVVFPRDFPPLLFRFFTIFLAFPLSCLQLSNYQHTVKMNRRQVMDNSHRSASQMTLLPVQLGDQVGTLNYAWKIPARSYNDWVNGFHNSRLWSPPFGTSDRAYSFKMLLIFDRDLRRDKLYLEWLNPRPNGKNNNAVEPAAANSPDESNTSPVVADCGGDSPKEATPSLYLEWKLGTFRNNSNSRKFIYFQSI